VRLAELAGSRTVVWGLGVEGRAAARAAVRMGASQVVAVTDEVVEAAAAASWERAGLADVPVLRGGAAETARRGAEVLVVSPGVSRYRPEILAAERRGTRVTNGTALFLSEHADRTIAITGSKGKSTVTRLVAHLLGALGRDVVAAGNVGTSLLDLIDTDHHRVVAEVSSYQAALVDHGPDVAVLTALFPDHLPWHGSVERYYADKLRLLTRQREGGRACANGADPEVRARWSGGRLEGVGLYASSDAEARVERGMLVYDDVAVLPLARSRLAGAHNAANMAGAVAVLAAAGVDVRAAAGRLREALVTFAPLPHRLEVIATARGVIFVDDSLATTPQAAIAACRAFPDRPLVLLVGGHDRGVDYAPLVAYLQARAACSPVSLLAMGAAGRRIATLIEGVPVEVCDDVARAAHLGGEMAGVRASGSEPVGGDPAGLRAVVLLSPAAPSPAPYGTYDRRSQAFRSGVEHLQQLRA
jgi:UDP-N-acetylmuramoylalanine--D-glutamate ligase